MILTTNGGTSDSTIAVAVHAAFFMEGLQEESFTAVLDIWGQGCIELVSRMLAYAPFLNDLVDKADSVRDDSAGFPGVLPYEVSSPFGKWIANKILNDGAFPPDADCKEWLAKEVIAFFSKSEVQTEIDKITVAVREVVPISCPQASVGRVPVKLDEDQFWKRFRPVENKQARDNSWSRCMFETWGEDLQHVLQTLKADPGKIWTILDAEGTLIISNGYHYVNRIGYLISEVSAEDDVFYEISTT